MITVELLLGLVYLGLVIYTFRSFIYAKYRPEEPEKIKHGFSDDGKGTCGLITSVIRDS